MSRLIIGVFLLLLAVTTPWSDPAEAIEVRRLGNPGAASQPRDADHDNPARGVSDGMQDKAFSDAVSREAETGLRYSPHKTYEGRYEGRRIYQRPDYRDEWWKMATIDRVSEVPCFMARDAMNEKGFWRGTLIEEEGVCLDISQSEPSNFAVGNYLNFIESAGR